MGERKLLGRISEKSMCDVQRGSRGHPLKTTGEKMDRSVNSYHANGKKIDLASVLGACDKEATTWLGASWIAFFEHNLGFRVV